MELPNHPRIVEEFGQQKFIPIADSPRLLPYASSERDLLMLRKDNLKSADMCYCWIVTKLAFDCYFY